ncbi:MAG TPA: hypothetical protein VJ845_04245 [Haploplasma sp.]|nr:hypothetical protein [Haploplasma sp.]
MLVLFSVLLFAGSFLLGVAYLIPLPCNVDILLIISTEFLLISVVPLFLSIWYTYSENKN